MLSRTKRIDEFHLKLSRTEKELYEEFLKTEEAALEREMQQYFAQAKGHAGGIRFDNASLWSKIENRVRRLVRGGLCRQEPKRKPDSAIKRSDLAPNEKFVGQDDQGIAWQEVREFKRSAIRQRKSDPRTRKRGVSRAAQVLAGPDMFSGSAFAKFIGVSREAVRGKHQRHEVLGLKGAKRGPVFRNGRLVPTAVCYRFWLRRE